MSQEGPEEARQVFDEVRFLAGSVPMARRLPRVVGERPEPAELDLIGAKGPASRLAPSPGPAAELRTPIDQMAIR